ncbi:MAG: hypothetical protein ACOWWM_14765 [Desulfobacterales bacterium]
MDYSNVVQIQLKTPADLRDHLERNGRAQHIVRDTASNWWWFCDDRNRLLEFVFNSGNPVTFVRCPESASHPEARWRATLDSGHGPVNVELNCPFQSPVMTVEDLRDLFWSDFLSQDIGSFAYWDIDNPGDDLDEFIFYWEIAESGSHLEPPVIPAAAPGLR